MHGILDRLNRAKNAIVGVFTPKLSITLSLVDTAQSSAEISAPMGKGESIVANNYQYDPESVKIAMDLNAIIRKGTEITVWTPHIAIVESMINSRMNEDSARTIIRAMLDKSLKFALHVQMGYTEERINPKNSKRYTAYKADCYGKAFAHPLTEIRLAMIDCESNVIMNRTVRIADDQESDDTYTPYSGKANDQKVDQARNHGASERSKMIADQTPKMENVDRRKLRGWSYKLANHDDQALIGVLADTDSPIRAKDTAKTMLIDRKWTIDKIESAINARKSPQKSALPDTVPQSVRGNAGSADNGIKPYTPKGATAQTPATQQSTVITEEKIAAMIAQSQNDLMLKLADMINAKKR